MATTIKTPKDGALWALEKGFRVFPIRCGGKKPAVEGWQEWATKSSPFAVASYPDPEQANWGIYCGGSGLLVVDADVSKKPDGTFKRGIQNWEALCAERGGAQETTHAQLRQAP